MTPEEIQTLDFSTGYGLEASYGLVRTDTKNFAILSSDREYLLETLRQMGKDGHPDFERLLLVKNPNKD